LRRRPGRAVDDFIDARVTRPTVIVTDWLRVAIIGIA
jgi:hypothetical protein